MVMSSLQEENFPAFPVFHILLYYYISLWMILHERITPSQLPPPPASYGAGGLTIGPDPGPGTREASLMYASSLVQRMCLAALLLLPLWLLVVWAL
jgi:hypothetical protein